LVGRDGGVFAFGADHFAGSLAGTHLAAPIVAALPNADATRNRDGSVEPSGYLLVDAAGHVYPIGNTRSLGDLSGLRLRAPIVDAVGDSRGYLMVGADGGVFTFGRIRFHGSLARQHLTAPIVGVALTGTDGYWLVSRQGGVWPFGDARSIRVIPYVVPFPLGPFIGIAGDGRNDGYWLATSDGHVFGLGSAHSYGDLSDRRLAAPIVRVTAVPSGYYLLGADGGVFAFQAPFLGSMTGHRLAQPATGMYFRFIPNSCVGLPPGAC
jgi:hypothetical protein